MLLVINLIIRVNRRVKKTWLVLQKGQTDSFSPITIAVCFKQIDHLINMTVI